MQLKGYKSRAPVVIFFLPGCFPLITLDAKIPSFESPCKSDVTGNWYIGSGGSLRNPAMGMPGVCIYELGRLCHCHGYFCFACSLERISDAVALTLGSGCQLFCSPRQLSFFPIVILFLSIVAQSHFCPFQDGCALLAHEVCCLVSF